MSCTICRVSIITRSPAPRYSTFPYLFRGSCSELFDLFDSYKNVSQAVAHTLAYTGDVTFQNFLLRHIRNDLVNLAYDSTSSFLNKLYEFSELPQSEFSWRIVLRSVTIYTNQAQMSTHPYCVSSAILRTHHLGSFIVKVPQTKYVSVYCKCCLVFSVHSGKVQEIWFFPPTVSPSSNFLSETARTLPCPPTFFLSNWKQWLLPSLSWPKLPSTNPMC